MQKRVIELLILSLFGIFISVNFISASSFTPLCNITTYSTCQSYSPFGWNIVMGLSNYTNAHGDFPWNYSSDNYQYVLCCSFSQGQTPSACLNTNPNYGGSIPLNKIIGLTNIFTETVNTTNAHAEGTGGTNYLVNVCWSGLECINQTQACSPSSPYSINVLNLSDNTNAHIGTGNGFNTAICCKYIPGGVNPLPPGSPGCNLTSATWSVNNATQGDQVQLIVNGTNCWSSTIGGADVSFNITTANGQPAAWNVGDATFPSSGPLVQTWTVPYISSLGSPNQYVFTAFTYDNSTQSGPPNQVLSTWPIGNLCSYINTCTDYNDLATCNSDPCKVAPALASAVKNPTASSYQCGWVAANNACNFQGVYNGNGPITCLNGYTLCTTGTNYIDYCYPGNVCPSGDFPPSKGNNICGTIDSCASLDCNNGQQGSCAAGALCSNGLCSNSSNVANVTTCGNGYALCLQPYKSLTYCYPSNQCPSGDVPAANSCIGATTGSSSTSCQPNLLCNNGLCSNSTAYYGKCLYTFINTGGNCSSGNGFLSYNWTVSWTGNQQQIPPTCTSGGSAIECPAQVSLSFFTAGNTIAVIILLILIYIAIIIARNRAKNNKEKSKRKKKR